MNESSGARTMADSSGNGRKGTIGGNTGFVRSGISTPIVRLRRVVPRCGVRVRMPQPTQRPIPTSP